MTNSKVLKGIVLFYSLACLTACTSTSSVLAGGPVGLLMCAGGYCANEEPEKLLDTGGQCAFNAVPGKEFKVAKGYELFAKQSSMFDKGRKRIYQTPESSFNALLQQNFKIVSVDAETVETENAKQSVLGPEYRDVEINKKPFKLDLSYSTKVVTQDCSLFYISMVPRDLTKTLVFSDGRAILGADAASFYGSRSLSAVSITPEVTFDKFENLFKVVTPEFDGLILRGSVVKNSGEEVALQIYTTVGFKEDWAHINRAYSETGEELSVTNIKSTPDCDAFSLGFPCTLEETIGINVSRKFLEKHRSGVEMKLSGRQSAVIYIPGILIEALLVGLNQAKS